MATTDQDLQGLKVDFSDLRKDVGDLSRDVKDLIANKSKQGYERVKDATARSVRQVENEIEEHPFASVGVALGVGFLVGVLIDRLARS